MQPRIASSPAKSRIKGVGPYQFNARRIRCHVCVILSQQAQCQRDASARMKLPCTSLIQANPVARTQGIWLLAVCLLAQRTADFTAPNSSHRLPGLSRATRACLWGQLCGGSLRKIPQVPLQQLAMLEVLALRPSWSRQFDHSLCSRALLGCGRPSADAEVLGSG